jgi:hypothetical protein
MDNGYLFDPEDSYTGKALKGALAAREREQAHGTIAPPRNPRGHAAALAAADLERALFPSGLPAGADMMVNYPGFAGDLLGEYAYDGMTPGLGLEGLMMAAPWLRTGNKMMRRGMIAFPRLYEEATRSEQD